MNPKKVFVTVGTHPQQFNRLLKEIDSLAGRKIIAGVFCQTGFSDYKPKNCEWKKFLTLEEFSAKMKEADLIVTHAGEGNIGLGKNLGKKMVIVPRRKEFGEHTNDHQLELAKIAEQKKLGLVVGDMNLLEEKISGAEKFVPAKVPKGRIVELLEGFFGD